MTASHESGGEHVVQPPLPPDHHHKRGRRESFELYSARVPFRLKLVAVWALILCALVGLFAAADFDTAWMRENAGFIARGITWTIVIAVLAIALACVLALLGALGRLSRNAVAVGLTSFYTSFFRGTPLIVQLFLIYLALPQIGIALGDPLGRPPHARRPHRRCHRAGAELRRLHDGDLPGGHPVGRPRSVRGRGGDRHDVRARRCAGSCSRRPSA